MPAPANRPRVADPTLLLMMQIAKRPEMAFAELGRQVDRVCARRREAYIATGRLRRAVEAAREALEDCRGQKDWLDGFERDGISVDDLRTCVQELVDMPDDEIVNRLLDKVDPLLLGFVSHEPTVPCPLCGVQNGA